MSGVLSLAAAMLVASPSQADPGKAADNVRPLLVRHCGECHGGEKPKGDFRLKDLDAGFSSQAAEERWQSVLDQVRSGVMPPKKKARLPEADLQALTKGIGHTLSDAASRRRAAQGRVVLRRLNRVEYTNTINDLLGVQVELREFLALDGSMDGFDNNGSALHLSSFAMERYLDAVGAALNVAIANKPAPATSKNRYSLKDQHAVITYGNDFFRVLDDTVVCFLSSHDGTIWISQFYPRDRGMYRVRISASGFQSDGKPVSFEVSNKTTGL